MGLSGVPDALTVETAGSRPTAEPAGDASAHTGATDHQGADPEIDASASSTQADVQSLQAGPGGAAEYLYDAAGRLAAVVSDESGEVAEYSYDAAGNITEVDRRSASELSVVSLVPLSAAPGQTVRVFGTGFPTDALEISVGNDVVQVSDVTPTSASFVVPATGSDGPVTVDDGNQSVQGPDLAVVADAVELDQVTPASAVPGAEVVLAGSGFDPDPVANVVTFNGQVAEIASATPTELRVVVPSRAGTGPLEVRTSHGATSWGQDFAIALAGVDPATVESVRRADVGGTAVSIPVTAAGRVALVHFDAPASRRVDIGLTGTTFAGGTRYRVIAPDNEVLADETVSGQTRVQAKGMVPGRTYALLVTPASGSTGQVTVTVSEPVQATATTSGAATSLAINRAGQTARVELDLEAGQNLTLALASSTLGWRWVELLDQDGLSVADEFASGASDAINLGEISSSGTYTVLVRPDTPTTGSVNLTASVRRAAGPISLTGGPTSFVVQRAGQEVAGMIDLNEGDVPTFAMSGSTVGWRWVELFAPDGTRVDYDYSSGTTAVMNGPTITASGTYTVVVRPDGPTTGSVSVTASLRAEADELVLDGGPTSFVVQRAGQEVVARLDLVAGQDAALAWTVTSLGARYIEVFNPQGTRIVSRYSFTSPDSVNLTAVAVTGEYTVVVRPTTTATGSVQMTAATGALTVLLRQGARVARAKDMEQSREPSGSSTRDEREGSDGTLPQWRPDKANLGGADWYTRRPEVDAPKDLEAPAGVTAVAGHVLGLDGAPVTGVTVTAGDDLATTDRAGRFLLKGVSATTPMIVVDGSTANTPIATYGTFRIHVELAQGGTTALPATVWMPALDTENVVELATPTAEETVLTTPYIPGLEVRLPAGTVVRDAEGELVDELGITPIPVDRPPFPLPDNGIVPTYFTVQPGGTFVFPEGAQIVYPNYTGLAPETRVEFWNYDPEERGWYVYGHGTVSEDAQQVVPDDDTRVWSFDGAMFNVPSSEKFNQSRFSDFIDWLSGDPVDLSTGLFTDARTDLAIDDGIAPISIERHYWQGDQASREFGRGQQLSYGMFLYSEDEYQEVDLYLAGGSKVHYERTSRGTGYTDAAFRSVATTGAFRDSTITWNDDGWSLRTRDGLTYWFPDWSRGSAITDRNGNTVTLTRDGADGGGPGQDLTQITSPTGRWIKLAYDSSHRVTEVRDNIGRTVTYTYNSAGRLSTVTNPAGDTTEYTYDTAGRVSTITDARGITFLTNQYDTNGRVARQTLAGGQTYEFDYVLSSWGTVQEARVTHQDGTQRHVTFNNAGVATSDTVVAAGGSSERATTFTRRADNLITQVTDPYGRVSTYDYDDQGRLESTTVLAGTSDEATLGTTVYGRFDQPTRHTDPAGNVTELEYDRRGNIVDYTDAEGRSRTATYTSKGQVKTVTDGAGNTTTLTYAAGDLVATTSANGETARYFTDAVGRRTTTIFQTGATRTVDYDVLNQPVRTTDPLGNFQEYEYDANGNLTTFTDAAGHSTHWTFDDADRIVERTDPLGAADLVTYDLAGRVTATTSRAGRSTTYAYDSFGRIDSTSDAYGTAEVEQVFEYDSLDRLAEVTDSVAGTTSYAYDALDRLTQLNEPTGASSYTYDENSQVISAVVAGQAARLYTYDDTGQLTGVEQGSTNVELTRDIAGRVSEVELPGGWNQSYTYDSNNLVVGLGYDHNGQDKGDLSYAYQPGGQVAAVDGSHANVVLPAARSGLEYDDQNRLVSAGGVPLSYDADGNLLDDGTRTYDWDASGSLESVTQGTSVTEFGYSPTGTRASRSTDGSQTGFVEIGPNVAAELDGDGDPAASLLSGGMDQWFARTHAGGTDAVLTDMLGSPIALGSADGSLAAEYDYDPFGLATVDGDTRGSDLGFTGRQNDGTGLTYHRSRYYQPATGRFISEDPIGFSGGSNLYTYGANAPTTYTDPTGNNPLLIGCLAGAAIDGGIDYTMQRLSGRKVQWGQVGAAAAQGCAIGMLGPLAGTIMKTGRIGADASAAARVADEYATLPLQHITNSGDTVLGHKGWIAKAQARGASYFDIGNQWNVIADRGGSPWFLNRAFLDDRIAAGDRVLVSVPKGRIEEISYLTEEIEYLLENGYQWVNQWALKPKG